MLPKGIDAEVDYPYQCLCYIYCKLNVLSNNVSSNVTTFQN